MAQPEASSAISVAVYYIADEQLTQARYLWPENNRPENTYTIDVTADTSVEVDLSFPARLSSISMNDKEADCEVIDTFAGRKIREALLLARSAGMLILSAEVLDAQKLALARVQLKSPSTPPALRRALRSFLLANEQAPHHEPAA